MVKNKKNNRRNCRQIKVGLAEKLEERGTEEWKRAEGKLEPLWEGMNGRKSPRTLIGQNLSITAAGRRKEIIFTGYSENCVIWI